MYIFKLINYKCVHEDELKDKQVLHLLIYLIS